VTGEFFTRSERAYGRLQAKRYKLAIEQKGLCYGCRWRDKETRGPFGMWKCNGYEDRMHLHCEEDGKLPKFTYDDDTLERLKRGNSD
jgi:hypothetical protein